MRVCKQPLKEDAWKHGGEGVKGRLRLWQCSVKCRLALVLCLSFVARYSSAGGTCARQHSMTLWLTSQLMLWGRHTRWRGGSGGHCTG